MQTFDDLFRLYMTKHADIRTRAPQNARYFFKVHGKAWQAFDIPDISQDAVQDWFDEIAVRSGIHGANRALNLMSAVINWGIKRRYVSTPNPCNGIDRFPVRSRERFLLPDEMQRFKVALEEESPLWRDFFWMLLLTGARRGNVQSMRWEDIQISLGIWRIPIAKNGESHHVPLTPPALAILERRKPLSESTEYVFPSGKREGCINDTRRVWARLMKRAQIKDLRVHDLRRTVGSYLAIAGHNGYLIGKVLGHKDRRSTDVYARLNLEPVRLALETTQRTFLT